MATSRVFGRRQNSFEPVLLGIAKRHARRGLSGNLSNQGREILVLSFMNQCEAYALGRPDGRILKGMKGWEEAACEVFTLQMAESLARLQISKIRLDRPRRRPRPSSPIFIFEIENDDDQLVDTNFTNASCEFVKFLSSAC